MSSIAPASPQPRLEVRDLSVVIAVGAARTTGAAARLLHITQSAVSRALRVAEAHAGVPLFDRTRRGLVPTAAGLVVLEAAPEMLAQLAALERRVREPATEPERIALVAECYMVYPWLAPVVARLRRARPQVLVDIPTEHTATAPDALLTGAVDFAILTSAVPRGLGGVELFEDEMCLVVAQHHPLAEAAEIAGADLAEHTLFAPTTTSADRWFVRQIFGRGRGAKLEVQRFPITEAMVEFARAGLGVAVLSEWVAAEHLSAPDSGLVVVRLASGPLLRSWRLGYRPEQAHRVELLRDAILGARPVGRVRR